MVPDEETITIVSNEAWKNAISIVYNSQQEGTVTDFNEFKPVSYCKHVAIGHNYDVVYQVNQTFAI